MREGDGRLEPSQQRSTKDRGLIVTVAPTFDGQEPAAQGKMGLEMAPSEG